MASGAKGDRVRRVVEHVRQDRLWQRHMDIARYGATPAGGVNRQALSSAEADAKRYLIQQARARGLSVYTDAIGNFFVRLAGEDPDLPPVLAGSHIDSQPTGGRFDGIYGVLAGFEVLEAFVDAGVR